MRIAHIALGANLPSPAGAPSETLDAAILRIAELGTLRAKSSYYTTEPIGYTDQPLFLNAAVALETLLSPLVLLDRLLDIELDFGRDRTTGIANGPRTLDLDLVLYGDLVLGTQLLALPHPRMAQRSFVLLPMEEIAPRLIHPKLMKTMSQLLQDLSERELS